MATKTNKKENVEAGKHPQAANHKDEPTAHLSYFLFLFWGFCGVENLLDRTPP